MLKKSTTQKKEQKEKDLSSEAFAIYLILKNKKINNAEKKAKEMEKVLNDYPHWQTSEEDARELRLKAYKILHGIDDKTETLDEIMRILKKKN